MNHTYTRIEIPVNRHHLAIVMGSDGVLVLKTQDMGTAFLLQQLKQGIDQKIPQYRAKITVSGDGWCFLNLGPFQQQPVGLSQIDAGVPPAGKPVVTWIQPEFPHEQMNRAVKEHGFEPTCPWRALDVGNAHSRFQCHATHRDGYRAILSVSGYAKGSKRVVQVFQLMRDDIALDFE